MAHPKLSGFLPGCVDARQRRRTRDTIKPNPKPVLSKTRDGKAQSSARGGVNGTAPRGVLPTADRISTPKKDRPAFHEGWQQWLAENLVRNVAGDKVVSVMRANGFSDAVIERETRSILKSPIFRGGRKMYDRNRKAATLLEALGTTYRQSQYADSIPTYHRLSPARFYRDYFYANRPVVLRGLMQGWPALKLWTPDYLARHYGAHEVEITDARRSDSKYEDRFSKHCKTLRFDQFIQRLKSGGETNDYYLVGKNRLLQRDEFRPLLNHLSCPRGYLDPKLLPGRVKLWFGPKGTVTPMHHDACSILFGQVYGRKRVKLISPFDLSNVYNDRECFSAVDPEFIDEKRFPLMRRVPIIDVILHPGDFLLLPVGWWHWVKALDISISLSFTNFYTNGPIAVWGYRYR